MPPCRAEQPRYEVDLLPPVDLAGKGVPGLIMRRRLRVRNPAAHVHAVSGLRRFHLRAGVRVRIAADGSLVNVAEMREVEEIIVEHLPVAGDL